MGSEKTADGLMMGLEFTFLVFEVMHKTQECSEVQRVKAAGMMVVFAIMHLFPFMLLRDVHHGKG